MDGGLAGRCVGLKPTVGCAIATHLQERFVANCSDLKGLSLRAKQSILVARMSAATSGAVLKRPRMSLRSSGLRSSIPHSRGANAPELCKIIRPTAKRAQGMPGACCTRGLVCNSAKKDAHEHTGTAEALRHSLRSGFTAYAALSPETNSFCLRRRRIEGLS